MTKKKKVFILCVWLMIVWPIGLYSLPRLMKRADSTFEAVSGTPAAVALNKYLEAYSPINSNSSNAITNTSLDSSSDSSRDPHFKPVIVIFQLDDHSGNGTLVDETSIYFNATKDYIYDYTTYLEDEFSSQSNTFSMESFYHLYSMFPVLAKRSMASPNGKLIMLKINPPSSKLSKSQLFDFLDKVTSYTNRVVPPFNITVSYTGLTLFQQDMIVSSKNDVSHLDTISLPVSLLILGYVLGTSIPVLILPVMTIISAIALWSSILYAMMLTTSIEIAQFTPSIMMSLTIAMSVDYSLFYLSRILEELRTPRNLDLTSAHAKQQLIDHANLSALATAGHSVLVSGSTLSMCLLGLTILPLNMMASTGIGSFIAVTSCIVVNLTMLPSILHTKVGRWLIFHEGFNLQLNYCSHRQNLNHGVHKMVMKTRKTLSGICFDHDYNLEDDNVVDETPLLSHNGLELEYELDSIHNDNQSYDTNSIYVKETKTDEIDDNEFSIWMRFGQFILLNRRRCKAILIILVFLFILPVSYFLFQMKTSIAMEMMIPYNSPSFLTFQTLGEVFGKGSLSPYQIIFDGRKSQKRADSSEGFKFMYTVLKNLTDEDMMTTSPFRNDMTNEDMIAAFIEAYDNGSIPSFETNNVVFGDDLATDFENDKIQSRDKIEHERGRFPATPTLSSFAGISVLNGTFLPHPIYEAALLCMEIESNLSLRCPIPGFRAISYIANRTCSESHLATSITAILEVDPFTNAGVDWLNSARSVLQRMTSEQDDFDVYIIGGAANEYDAINAIFESFPRMILLTCFIVFVFMGVSFQSVGAPIRSVVSIGATLSFVYGLAVLVYQYGILSWTNLRCFQNVGAISFLPPIMAFTVVVGLGLDYDVFLTTRILEYRTLGYTHTSSILMGLDKTGRIITAAGIIMCVAFGGLFFSDSMVLNQFSFFLVSSVMLDTFMVRTILVPIVLQLSGKWGWWPRKFPVGVKTVFSSSI